MNTSSFTPARTVLAISPRAVPVRRLSVALLWLTACCVTLVPSMNAIAADPSNPAESTAGLTQEDLEELVAPIALYPDMLLANVLAASVFPADVIAARTMRAGGGDPVEGGDDAWDPSVRMVAAFPVVLDMLADYPEWTTALGEAYLVQAGDVMDAIQSLRAVAWDNGALQTTPQHVIVKEGPTIIIEPADPQIIFVPQYTPSVVFVRNPPTPLAVGVVSFGFGVAVGAIWSNNVNCNWGGRCVAWGPGWWGRPNRVNININNNRNTNINVNRPGGRPGAGGSPWRPPPNRVPGGGISRPGGGASTPGGGISRPGGGSSTPGGGISRPGGGTWRPGGGSSTPGGGISRPGGGGGTGGGSSIGGGSGIGGGGRPSTPPAINRPGGGGSGGGLTVPSRRPGGNTGGLTGGTARPNPPQARPNPPQVRPPGGSARPQPPSGGQSSISRPGGGRPSAQPAPPSSRPGGGAGRPAAPPRNSAFQPGGGGAGGRAPAARPSSGGGAGAGGGGGGNRGGGARNR